MFYCCIYTFQYFPFLIKTSGQEATFLQNMQWHRSLSLIFSFAYGTQYTVQNVMAQTTPGPRLIYALWDTLICRCTLKRILWWNLDCVCFIGSMKTATAVYIIALQCITACTHSNNASADRPSEEATTAATHSSRAMESLPDDYNESGSNIDNDNDLTEDDGEYAIIPHR